LGEEYPPVLEKVQGKRAVVDEPARKKRKTTSAIPRKPRGISLGGDPSTQTQSAAMSKWSDDDRAPVAPPPSTEAPPRNTRMVERSKRAEGLHKQQAKGVPE